MDDALVLKKRGYTLGISLGEGSYAKVKSAYSDRLKSNVAVKIINRRKAPVDFLERFLPRELEILAVLNNRYIVKTYEIFETSDGKVYMIMELGVQGDLLEFIKFRGALPEEVCRKMFRQLSLAVKYIHDLEIVHRDLKCENLLLDKDFNLKVSDFGFSRRCNYDDDGQLGLSKTFCGSAAYAAPEVLQGIPYNAKVYDIWSMGVVLYIMLCGSMPYDDSNVKKMLRVQKEHRVDFPRGKHVPADCKDLLYRMLQPDVSKRIEIDDILDHPWLQPSKQKKDCESCSKSSSKIDTKGETKADSRNESRRGLRADTDDEFDSEVLDEAKAEKKGFKSHCTEPTPTRAAGNRRKSSQKVKETIEEGD